MMAKLSKTSISISETASSAPFFHQHFKGAPVRAHKSYHLFQRSASGGFIDCFWIDYRIRSRSLDDDFLAVFCNLQFRPISKTVPFPNLRRKIEMPLGVNCRFEFSVHNEIGRAHV